MKGVRSLELGRSGLLFAPTEADRARAGDGTEAEDETALRKRLAIPSDRRMWDLFRAIDRGWPLEQIHQLTHIDPWFLRQFAEIAEHAARRRGGRPRRPHARTRMRRMKRSGFGDQELALALKTSESAVRERREAQGVKPVYKRVDTCAAEFESFTPYLYSSYEPTCEANPNAKPKVVILGSGPNRIGQGIEFDYCCCHAAFALREEGLETVMINCNPETVSTDYDTADRLYFQPLTFEDVMAIIETEAVGRRRHLVPRAVRRADAAQAVAGAAECGRAHPGHVARLDRSGRGSEAVRRAPLAAADHAAGERHGDVAGRGARGGRGDRVPGRRPPLLRARRARHGDRLRRQHARSLHDACRRCLARASRAGRQVPRGRLRVRRRRDCRRDRRRRHRRHHGAHRGGRHPFRRQLVRRAAVHLPRAPPGDDSRLHAAHCARARRSSA